SSKATASASAVCGTSSPIIAQPAKTERQRFPAWPASNPPFSLRTRDAMLMSGKTSFDFGTLSERQKYKLLIGAVVPRPIALVTTIDRQGRTNAAPFSFFNCLSAEPAILALGVENHDDTAFKDTARNIRNTGVFTVNIVSDRILEAMNVCAVPFAQGIDELQE